MNEKWNPEKNERLFNMLILQIHQTDQHVKITWQGNKKVNYKMIMKASHLIWPQPLVIDMKHYENSNPFSIASKAKFNNLVWP